MRPRVGHIQWSPPSHHVFAIDLDPCQRSSWREQVNLHAVTRGFVTFMHSVANSAREFFPVKTAVARAKEAQVERCRRILYRGPPGRWQCARRYTRPAAIQCAEKVSPRSSLR